MKVALPDCRGYEDPFTLSAEDRRELVRRIAEKGAAAIDEFVREREAAGDSLIARKVQKLREELMRRAEELKRRLSGEFAEREEAIEAEYRARLAQLQSEEAALRGDLERMRGPGDLAALLRASPVLGIALSDDRVARAPWWRRLLAGLAKALRILLFPVLWLLRLLLPKRKSPDRAAFVVPGGGGSIPLSRAGDLYLSDAGFREAVKSRLRAAPARERLLRAWERLLGLEDYESLAQKAMAQMVAEEAEKAERERARESRRIEETLGEVLQREEEARRRRALSARELREEAEREARRIEEALRNAPEQEVKDAIVDELKSAGLLKEGAKGLMPTMQFMDRFAALVYDEEAAGGASRAATGEYAEGEGHYLREPLRSAIEMSRMDIPATLLRARSRHPNVRRLTDDDVVVYREERTGVLHVVLIVDRSGSMEENGRMDAAKRAALALHHAVKAQNPRNKVDILLMDTSVRKVSLRDVWETEPRGFTNTGAAIRLARDLAERQGRTLVYLITDGLPEAYTKEGEDVAGHPKKAMDYAKAQARELVRERGFAGFVMLLLEPETEMYVKAAEELAREAHGRVVPVDPHELARTLLRQFDAGQAAPVPR